jgi:alkaline phosphatase
MKGIILIINVLLVLANCEVFSPPNSGGTKYWHDYNIKFLQKVLNSQKPEKVAKNVILFVGDGMSFPTITAGRILKGQLQGKSGEEADLVFDDFPQIALSKTYNTDKQVPDSSATATALFSGIKTSFFAVGLNNPTPQSQESDRLKNILDWAQEKGKRTGLVTTTR